MNVFSKIYKKLIDVGKNLLFFNNKVSKTTHQRFSEYIKNSRVLTNPEEFLGENYEAVLNFWLIFDELSTEQLRIVKERYVTFRDENYPEWDKASDLALEAAKEVVDFYYAHHARWAAWDVTNSYAADWATLELIGMHKILEDHQQPLTFFPMFLDVL